METRLFSHGSCAGSAVRFGKQPVTTSGYWHQYRALIGILSSAFSVGPVMPMY